MKLHTKTNTLTTNVVNETQEFKIGNSAIIMEILQDRLYSKKVQTITQELISNALDTSKVVGKGSKFTVTIPTHLSPTFIVKDNGEGISPERISEIYTLYGNSTKRNDDVQMGAYGLGSKIPFCYVDSFSVTTVFDGVKRSYIAHQGTNRAGRLDLISTEETTACNGTEIQIAVNKDDIYEFRDGVFRTIYFWKQRPEIRGVVDVPTLIEGYTIGNCVEVIDRELLPSFIDGKYSENPLVVISGIPYEVESKLLAKCKTLRKLSEFAQKKIILHIGNGIVDVAASREAIADSPRTVEALEKIAHKVGMEIKTHIHDAFGKVKTPSEWFQTYLELSKFFNVENGFAQYGAYQIKNKSIVGAPLGNVQITYINCLSKRRCKNKIATVSKKTMHVGTEMGLNMELFPHTFYLRGDESGVIQNKRIKEYFQTHKEMYLVEVKHSVDQTTPAVLTLTPKQAEANFEKVVKDLGIKDFQSLPYTVVPKEERIKVKREKEVLCIHRFDGNRYFNTTLAENTKHYLYVPVEEDGVRYGGFEVEQLTELNSYLRDTYNLRVCGLGDRAMKMVEGEANFSSLKDWLNDYKPTRQEINYARDLKETNNDYVDVLKDIKGIKDAELVELVKEYKKTGLHVAGSVLPKILIKLVNEEQEVIDFEEQDGNANKTIKKYYPLLDMLINRYCSSLSKYGDEIAAYLNSKFEER
jgi:hypothetical protein